MGLGPPPKELTLLNWGRPFGKLPSEYGSEDFYWLSLAERFEDIRRLNTLWQDPATAKHLSRDAVAYIVGLRREVKELFKELRNGNEG